MARPRPGLLILFALCAVAFAASAPASLAAVQVAYRCDVDICLLDPDAPSTVTNLTDNGLASLDEAPVWSPDGTRVAFVSTFGSGARNIFVMTPGATGQSINLATQVTQYPNNGGYLQSPPVWSRDGTRIAFERKPSLNGVVGIFVAAADGTTAQPATITLDGVHPTWSPDGTKIAFSKAEQVYIANSDGSSSTPAMLENGAGHDPVWSPDGTRIAFDGLNAQEGDPFVDLHVVSATGGGTPVITPIHYTQWTFAAWSADGTRLAYRSTTDNDGHIRVVGADGSNDIGLAGVAQENDYAPSWSPDGTRVVFHGYHYNPADSNDHTDEIYMASTAGGGGAPQLLTLTGDKNYEPMWRPDPAYGPPLPPAPGPAPGPAPSPTPPVGGQQPPKVVWITSRIPWSPGTPSVTIGKITCPPNYGCRVIAAGIVPLHGIARTARKAKSVVVARGKLTVPAGATRALKLRLTRAGIALLRKRRTLTFKVAVTTTRTGLPKSTTSRTVRLKYVRAKRKRH